MSQFLMFKKLGFWNSYLPTFLHDVIKYPVFFWRLSLADFLQVVGYGHEPPFAHFHWQNSLWFASRQFSAKWTAIQERTLSMLKIKVRISETKYLSFYKSLAGSHWKRLTLTTPPMMYNPLNFGVYKDLTLAIWSMNNTSLEVNICIF